MFSFLPLFGSRKKRRSEKFRMFFAQHRFDTWFDDKHLFGKSERRSNKKETPFGTLVRCRYEPAFEELFWNVWFYWIMIGRLDAQISVNYIFDVNVVEPFEWFSLGTQTMSKSRECNTLNISKDKNFLPKWKFLEAWRIQCSVHCWFGNLCFSPQPSTHVGTLTMRRYE